MTGETTARRVANPLGALRSPGFRRLWTGQLLTTTAHWMDNLVRGWFVYQLTGSVTHLALVSGAKSVPLLFLGLFAGVLADRVSRRRLLVASQLLIAATHLALAVVVVGGSLMLEAAYATAALLGIARAFQGPARISLVPSLVPARSLHNAVVLSNGTGNVAQAVGPAVGGFLVATVGYASVFATQLALSLLAAWAIARVPELSTGAEATGAGMWRSIREGLSYVRGHGVILTLLLLALVPMFLGLPFQQLVPAVAEEVLDLGPEGAGLLLGMSGAGALMSLAALSLVTSVPRKGLGLLLTVMLFGASVLLFGLSTVFWLSLAAAWLAGATRGVYRTMNRLLLLTHTEDQYMGRVNSIYVLDRGLVPLGTLAVGLSADVIGTGPALAISGGLCVAVGVVATGMSTSLRRA